MSDQQDQLIAILAVSLKRIADELANIRIHLANDDLRERVETLEKDTHPPIDLFPIICAEVKRAIHVANTEAEHPTRQHGGAVPDTNDIAPNPRQPWHVSKCSKCGAEWRTII